MITFHFVFQIIISKSVHIPFESTGLQKRVLFYDKCKWDFFFKKREIKLVILIWRKFLGDKEAIFWNPQLHINMSLI